MISRNLCGSDSRRAISEISTGPCPYSLASTSNALSAYLDFCESNLVYELTGVNIQAACRCQDSDEIVNECAGRPPRSSGAASRRTRPDFPASQFRRAKFLVRVASLRQR